MTGPRAGSRKEFRVAEVGRASWAAAVKLEVQAGNRPRGPEVGV